MLTERWLRVRSVHLIKVKSSGSDRTLRVSDRTLSPSIRSTPVRSQRGRILIGRVRSVLTGRWSGLATDRTLSSKVIGRWVPESDQHQ